MHPLVLRSGNEACSGFRLIDRPIAVDLGAARLLFGVRPERPGGALGVIEALAITEDRIWITVGPQLRMQHGGETLEVFGGLVHAVAPFRICAM